MRQAVNAWGCTWGCTDTVRESALKADSGLQQWEIKPAPAACRPMLYQFSYILTQFGRMFVHSFPAALLCVCVCGDYLPRTNSTLHARISPQLLSELRQLWLRTPWRFTCQRFPDILPCRPIMYICCWHWSWHGKLITTNLGYSLVAVANIIWRTLS